MDRRCHTSRDADWFPKYKTYLQPIGVQYCLSGILQENASPIPLSTFTKRIKCNNTTNSPNIANSNCAVMISNHCIDSNCYINIPNCGVLNPDSNGQCPTNFTYMNESYGCIKQTFLGYQDTNQKPSAGTTVSFNINPKKGYYFPYGGNSDPNCEPDANSSVQCIESKNIIPREDSGTGGTWITCNNKLQYPVAYFINSTPNNFYWKYPNGCPCNNGNECVSGTCYGTCQYEYYS